MMKWVWVVWRAPFTNSLLSKCLFHCCHYVKSNSRASIALYMIWHSPTLQILLISQFLRSVQQFSTRQFKTPYSTFYIWIMKFISPTWTSNWVSALFLFHQQNIIYLDLGIMVGFTTTNVCTWIVVVVAAIYLNVLHELWSGLL